MNKEKIIAIIPARGGSKGLPGKNIRQLAGMPLIYYSIKAALDSKYIDAVFVSTDSEPIANTSERCGANIIKRPAELAKDDSPTIDTIFHAIEFLKHDYNPSVVVLLQPTSPLRDTHDIDRAIELFVANDYSSVFSMCEVEHSPYWDFKFDNAHLKPLLGDEYLKKRRQDLPKVYRQNGAIYISTVLDLYKNNDFYSGNVVPFIMPVDKSVDIDNEIDFKLAELLIQETKDGNQESVNR
ncbi:CMP-N-acetylneuraminic acid synthetase [Methanohalophilus levihalophilus]|uniref:acylneuraminate cytidylyltransferase family protein n=1 Tax=Methanohalophilus levihalophilus TaxID=1431282 RepID=UPI001AEB972E|nr:CMP-N-acetylneuraminic acid synthetase [Methanohalophilus levihalophilus]